MPTQREYLNEAYRRLIVAREDGSAVPLCDAIDLLHTVLERLIPPDPQPKPRFVIEQRDRTFLVFDSEKPGLPEAEAVFYKRNAAEAWIKGRMSAKEP